MYAGYDRIKDLILYKKFIINISLLGVWEKELIIIIF